MIVVVLTLLLCLLASAAVALFVAYPGRGRPLPEGLQGLRTSRRPAPQRRVPAQRSADRTAQEARD